MFPLCDANKPRCNNGFGCTFTGFNIWQNVRVKFMSFLYAEGLAMFEEEAHIVYRKRLLLLVVEDVRGK